MARTDGRLSAKVVAVTGAGQGMGRAEALLAAREGASVWVADINADGAKAVVEEISREGGEANAVALDVANPADWESFAAALEQDSGRLDGLVNNAGVSFRRGIAETTPEDWDRVMRVNLSSVFYGMKYLLPMLERSENASVVNVSSIAGMVGYFSATYGASKWGVRGLSKVGALEFAERGIRVNSIHPGLIDTPLLHSGPDDSFVNARLRSVPAGRVAEPEEVANAVLYLLSDESRYVSGTELVVDGGLTSGGLYHRILADLQS
jgi:3alpha(or 20beta)-hydroxysteroid dehydrogenase